MTEPITFGTDAYRQVVRGLIGLHRCIAAGREDSAEADAIRDSLDAPLLALSDSERARSQWLSEDLYSISDPGESGNSESITQEAVAQILESNEAQQRGDWDLALTLLRTAGKGLSPDLLSFTRGRIWLAAGDPEVAAEFFRHALGLSPNDGRYEALYLHALSKVDREAALARAEGVLKEYSNKSPFAVAYATDILFASTRKRTTADGLSVYRRLIPVLQHTIDRLDPARGQGSERSTLLMLLVTLSFCFELVGDEKGAIEAVSKGLEIAPLNSSLLVTRGILLYGNSPRAAADLEAAIELGTNVVWPYMFLAIHYLTQSRFDDCREMCEAALRRTNVDRLRAEIYEWLAISQAETGFPSDAVIATFEKAMRADPDNEQVRHNLGMYKAATRNRPVKSLSWESPSESSYNAARKSQALAAMSHS